MSDRLDELIRCFETIIKATVPKLRDFYSADSYFKDLSNEVPIVEQIE